MKFKFAVVFLLSALLATPALAEVFALGDTVAGAVIDPATPGAHSFAVAPGTTVFVQRLASNNTTKLNWALKDAFSRTIASDFTALGSLGPVALMGGGYTLTVTGEGAAVGTYSFVVRAVPALVVPITLGAAVTGAIDLPGRIVRHALTHSAGDRVFVNVTATSNSSGLIWWLEDSTGNKVLSSGTTLADGGPVTLGAVGHALVVVGEDTAVGTFTFTVERVVDSLTTAALDQSMSGTVAVGAVNTHRLTAPPGTRVFFDVTATSNSTGLNVGVFDALGRAVVPVDSTFSDVGPVVLAGGSYDVRVLGEGAATGTYAITARSVTDVSGALVVDADTAGSLTTPGQEVTRTFEVSAGLWYLDVLSTSNLSGLTYTVLDSLGQTVFPRTSSLADSGRLRLAAGAYQLRILGEGDATGSWSIRLRPVVDEVGVMTAFGVPITGNLDSPGERHDYPFTVVAPMLLKLDFTTSSAASSFGWTVTSAAGRTLLGLTTSLADVSGLKVPPGSYVLSVLGEGSVTGTFGFTLVDQGAAAGPPAGTQVALQDTLAGSLVDAADVDVYTFELTARSDLFFDLIVGASPLRWTLFDSAGGSVFGPSTIQYPDLQDIGPVSLDAGTYTLQFSRTTAGTSAYAAVVYDVTASDSPVGLDAPTTGAVSRPGEKPRYSFEILSPTRVLFDLTKASNSLEWSARDAFGHALFTDVSGFSTTSSDRGPFWLLPGFYTVEMAGSRDDTDTFGFTLVTVPADAESSLVVGTPITGATVTKGQRAFWAFSLAEPRRIYVDVTTGSSDLDLAVLDAFGQVLASASGVASFTGLGPIWLAAGEYRVRADADGSQTPVFGFAVLATTVTDGPLLLGQTLGGALQPGDLVRGHVTLAAPTWVHSDVTLAAATRWSLLSGGGAPIVSDVTMSSTDLSDRGPTELAAGTWTWEIDARDLTATVGLVPHNALRSDGGSLSVNVATEATLPAPAGAIRYAFVAPAADITFDLLKSVPGLRWKLVDPVGVAVFDADASDGHAHDRGPMRLAPGTYTLEVYTNTPTSPHFRFQVGAVAPDPIAGACASCRALDIVFVFDTSGSMIDEATLVCDLAVDLIAGLQARGVETRASFYGITDTATVPCIDDTVINVFGTALPPGVPPDFAVLGACPNGGQGTEDWALAAALLADQYDWAEGAVRLVIPVADEGPSCGDPINADDDLAVEIAGALALDRDVIISPIIPADALSAVHVLAESLAVITGGVATSSTFAESELASTVSGVAGSACTTEDETIRPVIEDFSPTLSPAGLTVVSGRVVPVNRLRPVVAVFVGGEPATAYDASGRFFHTVDLAAGETNVTIELVEGCGTFTEAHTVSASGTDEPSLGDFQSLGVALGVDWNRPSFALDDRNVLLADAVVQNQGDDRIEGPLLMVLGAPLDPKVRLPQPDGVTLAGEPYYEVLGSGAHLDSGEEAAAREVLFEDAARVPVLPGVRFLGLANRPPRILTPPVVRAANSVEYVYAAQAIDPDGQPLEWALPVGPNGMFVNSDGFVIWNPSHVSPGSTFEVVLVVDDGHGGTASQRFSVTVGSSTNSPPLFVTAPKVGVSVGAQYSYAAAATDADADVLTWSLLAGPAGLEVEPQSGAVTWEFPLPGSHSVRIQVDDGHGGKAVQAWTLSVGVLAEDEHAPAITSVPPGVALPAVSYVYPVQAADPDGDPLTYELVVAPLGMTIDALGRVKFVPVAAQIGLHPVTIRVRDDAFGEAEQSYVLVVSADPVNVAPYFVTTPAVSCLPTDTPWTYAAAAVDPDGSPIAWSITAGPDGLAVDGTTGMVTWTPTSAQVGMQVVALTASDGAASASQVFRVGVRDNNTAPTFPAVSAWYELRAGGAWALTARATDSDGDGVGHSVFQGPPGMRVEPITGRISWTPGPGDEGQHQIVIRAADDCGGTALLTFNVEVVLDTTPPTIAITRIPAGDVCQNGVTVLCLSGFDDVGIAVRELRVGGLPAALDPQGCTARTFTELGEVVLNATITDASQNTSTANVTLEVEDCVDPEPPVVTLLSPDNESVHAGPTAIVAPIADNNPDNLTWQVLRASTSTGEFVVIAEGVGPVTSGTVAAFDPTGLANDGYRIQIIASDGQQTGGVEFLLHATGTLKLGQYRMTVTDLSLEFTGVPIVITRTYDTLGVTTPAGDLAPGWTLGLGGSVSDAAKEGADPLFFAGMTNEAFGPNARVYVTRPDGRRVGFTFKPEALPFPQVFQQRVVYVADPGVTDSLEAIGPKKVWATGKYYDFIIPYNPDTYVLTTREGMKYRLSESKGLLRVENPAGQALDVTAAGIVSSIGVTIAFERDSSGRIAAIQAPAHPDDETTPPRIEYGYDGAGNLVRVTDASGATTTYHYDAPAPHVHHLTRITDPLLRPVTRLVYGPEGRITAICGAEANVDTLVGCERYEHDASAGIETIYTPRGTRVDRSLDAAGNVVDERVELSPTEHLVTRATYDSNGFPVRLEDAAGGVFTLTRDAKGRVLSQTDAAGRTFTSTYDVCLEPVTVRDPLGNVMTQTFDDACKRTSIQDPLGGKTTFGLTSSGDLETIEGPLGDTWTVTRNSLGMVTKQIDPLGRTAVIRHSTSGDVILRTDPTGRTIRYDYDAAQRPVVEHWDTTPETTITTTYDAAGQITAIDGPGVTTTATYTASGRLATVTSTRAGGVAVTFTYTYDASGNVASLADSRGGLTTYAYDAADRLTAVTQTDAAGLARRVELEVDGVGRRTALHRYANSVGTSAGSTQVGLVASTFYVYDAGGQLLGLHHRKPDDSVLLDITVTRDGLGNVTGLVDSDQGASVFAVDGARRLLSADRVSEDESYSYDEAGNRDFSHRSDEYTYSYELLPSGHELRSDSDLDYLYDAAGNLETMTVRTSGAKVAFEYDHRGRVIRLTRTDGQGAIDHEASYVLDAATRRAVETINGQTTHSFFDGYDPVLRILPDGSLDRRLYLGLDDLVADTAGGVTRWYLGDHMKSTRALLSDSGARLADFQYDAFGVLLDASGEDTDVLFTGRSFDAATGLGDYRSRTFDPRLGRFLQVDAEFPYRYEYADNNPLVFADPMGRNALQQYGQIVKSIALQLIKRHWKCVTTVVVMGAAGAVAYYEVGEGLSYLAGGAFAASTFEFLAKVIAPNWVDPFSKAKEGAAKLTRAVIKRVCF